MITGRGGSLAKRFNYFGVCLNFAAKLSLAGAFYGALGAFGAFEAGRTGLMRAERKR